MKKCEWCGGNVEKSGHDCYDPKGSMGIREIRKRCRLSASALIAAMDLQQLYGEEIADTADEETQTRMEQAKRELVKRLSA